MATSPKKSLALDTNLLLDLAAGKTSATNSERSYFWADLLKQVDYGLILSMTPFKTLISD